MDPRDADPDTLSVTSQIQSYIAATTPTDTPVNRPSPESISTQIVDLENQLRQRRRHIESLISSLPNTAPRVSSATLTDIHTSRLAFSTLCNSTPVTLSTLDSPLETLLAIRQTKSTITQSTSAISHLRANLSITLSDHESAHESESDLAVLESEIERRITRLSLTPTTVVSNGQLSDIDDIPTLVQQANSESRRSERRIKSYDTSISVLRRVLADFIDRHIAATLELEDTGKHAALLGDTPSAAVFRAITALQPSEDDDDDDEHQSGRALKQRRIDQMFQSTRQTQPDLDPDTTDTGIPAGTELKNLIESLISAYISPSPGQPPTTAGSSQPAASGPFIPIARESAVVRFLVRARIARFHPRHGSSMIALVPFAD